MKIIENVPVHLKINGRDLYGVTRGPYVDEINDGEAFVEWEGLTPEEQDAVHHNEIADELLSYWGNGYVQ